MVDSRGIFYDLCSDGDVVTVFTEYIAKQGDGMGIALCLCCGASRWIDFANDFWFDGGLSVQCAEIVRISIDGGCCICCFGICIDRARLGAMGLFGIPDDEFTDIGSNVGIALHGGLCQFGRLGAIVSSTP